GLNMVETACKLASGQELRDLALPPERPPAQVSVKAAVLPFARFPGSDPVLGPEMRSTGEVMASASDLPTAFAKAERRAGGPPHTSPGAAPPDPGGGVPLGARRRQGSAAACGRSASWIGLRVGRDSRDGAGAAG